MAFLFNDDFSVVGRVLVGRHRRIFVVRGVGKRIAALLKHDLAVEVLRLIVRKAEAELVVVKRLRARQIDDDGAASRDCVGKRCRRLAGRAAHGVDRRIGRLDFHAKRSALSDADRAGAAAGAKRIRHLERETGAAFKGHVARVAGIGGIYRQLCSRAGDCEVARARELAADFVRFAARNRQLRRVRRELQRSIVADPEAADSFDAEDLGRAARRAVSRAGENERRSSAEGMARRARNKRCACFDRRGAGVAVFIVDERNGAARDFEAARAGHLGAERVVAHRRIVATCKLKRLLIHKAYFFQPVDQVEIGAVVRYGRAVAVDAFGNLFIRTVVADGNRQLVLWASYPSLTSRLMEALAFPEFATAPSMSVEITPAVSFIMS